MRGDVRGVDVVAVGETGDRRRDRDPTAPSHREPPLVDTSEETIPRNRVPYATRRRRGRPAQVATDRDREILATDGANGVARAQTVEGQKGRTAAQRPALLRLLGEGAEADRFTRRGGRGSRGQGADAPGPARNRVLRDRRRQG